MQFSATFIRAPYIPQPDLTHDILALFHATGSNFCPLLPPALSKKQKKNSGCSVNSDQLSIFFALKTSSPLVSLGSRSPPPHVSLNLRLSNSALWFYRMCYLRFLQMGRPGGRGCVFDKQAGGTGGHDPTGARTSTRPTFHRIHQNKITSWSAVWFEQVHSFFPVIPNFRPRVSAERFVSCRHHCRRQRGPPSPPYPGVKVLPACKSNADHALANNRNCVCAFVCYIFQLESGKMRTLALKVIHWFVGKLSIFVKKQKKRVCRGWQFTAGQKNNELIQWIMRPSNSWKKTWRFLC